MLVGKFAVAGVVVIGALACTGATIHSASSQKNPNENKIYGSAITFDDGSSVYGIAGSGKTYVDSGPQHPINPAARGLDNGESFQVLNK